jgi:hypothetical protein
MRQITNVELRDPQYTCSILLRLLRYLFTGTIVVRLQKDRPSDCAYNTMEDYFLGNLQSTTTIPIGSLADRFTRSSDWIGIEDERKYILADAFSIRSTSTGHMICIPSSMLYKILRGSYMSRKLRERLDFHLPMDCASLCTRGMAQTDDSIGSSTSVRLSRRSTPATSTSIADKSDSL